MLFSNYDELSVKGILGKIFYWIRYLLCVFPIVSLIICIVWAAKTSSKNWTTIVNNTILILSIIVMILSIASFVFILFAALSLLRKFEKIFGYFYFFITVVAFIIIFVLLSFGNSSHEISYLSQFDKNCGDSADAPLIFPTPVVPMPTPSPTPPPLIPSKKLLKAKNIENFNKIHYNFNEYNKMKLLDTPIPTQSQWPAPTPLPPPLSQSAFCKKYWTSWSRRRYIRERTTDIKSVFAGIISPWVILFCVEFLIMLALNPPEFLHNIKNKANLDEDNALLDSNLLPDQQSRSQTQANENDNIQLEVDTIFRDEDASGEENTQTGSNV